MRLFRSHFLSRDPLTLAGSRGNPLWRRSSGWRLARLRRDLQLPVPVGPRLEIRRMPPKAEGDRA